jgi:Fe-S-cluster containining protein
MKYHVEFVWVEVLCLSSCRSRDRFPAAWSKFRPSMLLNKEKPFRVSAGVRIVVGSSFPSRRSKPNAWLKSSRHYLKKNDPRFADTLQKLETAGLLTAKPMQGLRALVSKETDVLAAWNDVSRRYYELHLDCPFLENDSCSIYEERPIACREYNAVTPPALCEAFDSAIETIERPVRLGEALTKAGNDLAKTKDMAIALPLVLEWVSSRAKVFSGEFDGEKMFWALVEAIEEST